jgi:hypothetical protein
MCHEFTKFACASLADQPERKAIACSALKITLLQLNQRQH